MKMATVSIVLIAITGCANSPTWYKSGATQASFEADRAECEYEALKHGGAMSPSFGTSYAVAMHRNEIAVACMRQKGYSQEPYQKQDPFTPVQVGEGLLSQ